MQMYSRRAMMDGADAHATRQKESHADYFQSPADSITYSYSTSLQMIGRRSTGLEQTTIVITVHEST